MTAKIEAWVMIKIDIIKRMRKIMKFKINDEVARIKIEKLQQIFNSEFGRRNYSFFGQS